MLKTELNSNAVKETFSVQYNLKDLKPEGINCFKLMKNELEKQNKENNTENFIIDFKIDSNKISLENEYASKVSLNYDVAKSDLSKGLYSNYECVSTGLKPDFILLARYLYLRNILVDIYNSVINGVYKAYLDFGKYSSGCVELVIEYTRL